MTGLEALTPAQPPVLACRETDRVFRVRCLLSGLHGRHKHDNGDFEYAWSTR